MLELQEGQKVLIIRYGKKTDCIKNIEKLLNLKDIVGLEK